MTNEYEIEVVPQSYREFLNSFPNQPLTAYQDLGKQLLDSGCLDDAELVYQTLIQNYPDQHQGYQGLAQVAMRRQHWLVALENWDRVLEKLPNHLWAGKGKASALLNLGRLNEAEQVFQQLCENYPNQAPGYAGLAQIATSNRDWDLAQSLWQKVLDKFPQNMAAYIHLGNALIELEQFLEAETIFTQLKTNFPDQFEGDKHLVRLAMRTENWQLAQTRVELARQLFPQEFKLFYLQAEILLEIKDFLKLEELIHQGKIDFPNQPSLTLLEADLKLNQGQESLAISILENALMDYPNNIQIQIKLVRFYVKLGELQEAKILLDEIQKQNPLILTNNMSLIFLYVKFLSQQKDLTQLRTYITQVIEELGIRKSAGLLEDGCRLLMMDGFYQEAIKLIDKILQESPIDRSFYSIQLRCLVVLETMKNLTAVNSVNELESSKNDSEKNIMDYIDKYPRFPEIKQLFVDVNQTIETIKTSFSSVILDSFISSAATHKVVEIIQFHIQQKIPLSMIRLGDGEGHFLEYELKIKAFQAEDQNLIRNVWFGDIVVEENTWQQLEQDYRLSIKNADLIGIPDIYRFCRSFGKSTKDVYDHQLRGLLAILYTISNRSFFDPENPLYKINKTIISCNIHQDLAMWGLYQLIFQSFNNCSVISCHENLVSCLQEKFNLKVNKLYKIPSQHKSAKLFKYQTDPERTHYHVFNQICEEITVNYTGEVFLVAAGFLGKIYCDIIKVRGGIALDIGSIVDYWLNYSTRWLPAYYII